MTAMLRAGSDKAAELYLEVNRKANDYVRSYEGKIIKGRQIIAMMYESFRTRDRPNMIVALGTTSEDWLPTSQGCSP